MFFLHQKHIWKGIAYGQKRILNARTTFSNGRFRWRQRGFGVKCKKSSRNDGYALCVLFQRASSWHASPDQASRTLNSRSRTIWNACALVRIHQTIALRTFRQKSLSITPLALSAHNLASAVFDRKLLSLGALCKFHHVVFLLFCSAP